MSLPQPDVEHNSFLLRSEWRDLHTYFQLQISCCRVRLHEGIPSSFKRSGVFLYDFGKLHLTEDEAEPLEKVSGGRGGEQLQRLTPSHPQVSGQPQTLRCTVPGLPFLRSTLRKQKEVPWALSSLRRSSAPRTESLWLKETSRTKWPWLTGRKAAVTVGVHSTLTAHVLGSKLPYCLLTPKHWFFHCQNKC